MKVQHILPFPIVFVFPRQCQLDENTVVTYERKEEGKNEGSFHIFKPMPRKIYYKAYVNSKHIFFVANAHFFSNSIN
jgi:hypothetical protein